MIINSAAELDNISNPAPDRINEDQNLGQAGLEMTQPTTGRQEMVSSVGGGSTRGWHCRVFIDFQSDILA